MVMCGLTSLLGGGQWLVATQRRVVPINKLLTCISRRSTPMGMRYILLSKPHKSNTKGIKNTTIRVTHSVTCVDASAVHFEWNIVIDHCNSES